MEKKDLLSAVMETLEKMGEKPHLAEIVKINDEILHSISLRTTHSDYDGSVVAPAIYLEQIVDDKLIEMLDKDRVADIARDVADEIKKRTVSAVSDCEHPIPTPPSPENFADYPLILGLCDKSLNRRFLSDKPHRDVGNGFALFLRLKTGEAEGGWFATNVTFDVLKDILNMTEEKAFDEAFAADGLADSSEFHGMLDSTLSMMLGREPRNFFLENEDSCFDPGGIYVLKDIYYGAAALYRPGMQEKIADLLKDDYYVLPQSRDEVVIIAAEFAPSEEELRGMVIFNVQDFLSDTIQKFDRRRNKMIPCMSGIPMYS